MSIYVYEQSEKYILETVNIENLQHVFVILGTNFWFMYKWLILTDLYRSEIVSSFIQFGSMVGFENVRKTETTFEHE